MGDDPTARARAQGEAHRVSPTEMSNYSCPTVSLPASFDPTADVLKPFPFFNYRDYSRVEDPDPCQHLTPPGRVPNFVAKMHAILSRADLVDIIGWLPHGRSWMILNPKKFEKEVLPVYFDHRKISSFIRQANGWGFRRITSGRDRNSYYHQKFLRALPHLCKDMKRPGVSEKQPSDPDHEPDLGLISQMFPVPEVPSDNSIYLQFILDQGPNARMPLFAEEPRAQFLTKTLPQPDIPVDPLQGSLQELGSIPRFLCQPQQDAAGAGSTGDQDTAKNNMVQLSQALAGLPPIPAFIPSLNGGEGGFDFSAFLSPNVQEGNQCNVNPESAYHAGFIAAQAMFASQGDQIEQQLLNDPSIFSSFQPSDHTSEH